MKSLVILSNYFCFLFVCCRDNTINVLFKLEDQKFQDCFKHFNIALLEKRSRTNVRKVGVPYLLDRQNVSYV